MLYLGASHNVSHDIQALHFLGTYLVCMKRLSAGKEINPRHGSELKHVVGKKLFCIYVPSNSRMLVGVNDGVHEKPRFPKQIT